MFDNKRSELHPVAPLHVCWQEFLSLAAIPPVLLVLPQVTITVLFLHAAKTEADIDNITKQEGGMVISRGSYLFISAISDSSLYIVKTPTQPQLNST